jgi:hypothetical protein
MDNPLPLSLLSKSPLLIAEQFFGFFERRYTTQRERDKEKEKERFFFPSSKERERERNHTKVKNTHTQRINNNKTTTTTTTTRKKITKFQKKVAPLSFFKNPQKYTITPNPLREGSANNFFGERERERVEKMSENDSDKLKYRKSMLKGSVDAESARRRREENNIKIRKSKKEERLQKRRMRNAVRLFYFVFSLTFYQIFKINFIQHITEIQCYGIFGRQVSDVQYDDDEYAEYDRRDDGATIETASDFVSSDSVPRFGEEIGSDAAVQKTSLHREKSSHF